MRHVAILAAAFVAGLSGAMSQEGVSPPVNRVHAAWTQQAAAAPAPAPAVAPAPQAVAAAEPAPPPQPAKPVRHVKKIAAKPHPKPAQVAEVHHSFWYRLFHKSENDRVAEAEPQRDTGTR